MSQLNVCTMVIKRFYVDYINGVDIYLQDFSDQITYHINSWIKLTN